VDFQDLDQWIFQEMDIGSFQGYGLRSGSGFSGFLRIGSGFGFSGFLWIWILLGFLGFGSGFGLSVSF
jgi:hypothetical protein